MSCPNDLAATNHFPLKGEGDLGGRKSVISVSINTPKEAIFVNGYSER